MTPTKPCFRCAPDVNPPFSPINWRVKVIKPHPTEYVAEILARKMGRSYGAIQGKRNQLHIGSAHLLSRPWSDAELKLLGSAPDVEVARQLGRSVGAGGFPRSELAARVASAVRLSEGGVTT